MDKRDLSLEVQLYTYLSSYNGTSASAKEIKKAFFGLASLDRIERILSASPFFNENDGLYATADTVRRPANIKYDFTTTGNLANIELWIDDKRRTADKDVSIQNVGLYGALYKLPIEVRVVDGPPMSWKLNVKEIYVTDPDFKHHRTLAGNPLEENGTYSRQYHTHLKD